MPAAVTKFLGQWIDLDFVASKTGKRLKAIASHPSSFLASFANAFDLFIHLRIL
jgi:hypothetical protein